jgi:hypothetical protein
MNNGVSDRIGFFASSMALARGLTFEVFAPLTDQGGLRNLDHPLSVFRSSPEFLSHRSRLGGVSSTSSTSPAVSFPFGVFPVPGSHISPEVTSLRLLPSQRFSRSQGLTPPGTCRPCFMPVPPLGFYPPGFIPPAEPHALSDAVALLWLVRLLVAVASCRAPGPFRVVHCAQQRFCCRGPMGDRPHFKALLPASVRSHGRLIRPYREP